MSKPTVEEITQAVECSINCTECYYYDSTTCMTDAARDAAELILAQEARIRELEAATPHAHWAGIEYDAYADGFPVYDVWKCSSCGWEESGEDVPDENPYCRTCGAKMDEEVQPDA